MRNILLSSLLVLITTPAALAEVELKGSPAELSGYLSNLPKQVTLTGKAELKTLADRAVVTVCVKTESSSLQTSLKSNQDLRTKIIDTLNKSGITPDRIVASKFSSTPKYGIFSKRPSTYVVENMVKITVTSEKDFQEVANIVDSFTEVEYQGIDFELSNKDDFKRQAMEQACDAVVKKKKIYEEKFGVVLVPNMFTEADVTELDPSGRPREIAAGEYLRAAKMSNITLSEQVSEASSFGQIVFYGNISVNYLIENP